MPRLLRTVCVLTVAAFFSHCLFAGRPSHAQPLPFYQGRTIRIIVGFTPGGVYDQYARILSRYMGKYIPGNPNLIVQNMPGAGSIIATNYVASVARPDG